MDAVLQATNRLLLGARKTEEDAGVGGGPNSTGNVCGRSLHLPFEGLVIDNIALSVFVLTDLERFRTRSHRPEYDTRATFVV